MTRCPITVIAFLCVVACGEDPVLTPSTPTTLTQLGTASGTPRWVLDAPLAVKLLDEQGEPMQGKAVTWSTTEDGAWLEAATTETDADGVARVAFAPGWRIGTQSVRASLPALQVNLSIAVATLTLGQVSGSPDAQSACGIDGDGAVWCWLPTGAPMPDKPPIALSAGNTPFAVDPARSYRHISWIAGQHQSYCGITTGGEMRCWDLPPWDRLTAGNPGEVLSVAINTPAQFTALAPGSRGNNTPASLCALDTGGVAWCRGANDFGELGDGTALGRDDFQPVAGEQRLHRLVSGGISFCGLDGEDHAWCWGGDFGEPVRTPTRMGGDLKFTDLGFSYYSACGIAQVGQQLHCWGYAGMDGVADLNGDGLRTEPFLISGTNALAEFAGGHGSDLGVFRWASGRIGYAGQMNHDPGYFGWFGHPVEVAPQGGPNWPAQPDGIAALLTEAGDLWCGRHQSGATVCAERTRRLVGVPSPH